MPKATGMTTMLFDSGDLVVAFADLVPMSKVLCKLAPLLQCPSRPASCWLCSAFSALSASFADATANSLIQSVGQLQKASRFFAERSFFVEWPDPTGGRGQWSRKVGAAILHRGQPSIGAVFKVFGHTAQGTPADPHNRT